MIDNKSATQARKTHTNNLLSNLAHRLEVAKANNDTKLISQLESELHYINLKS